MYIQDFLKKVFKKGNTTLLIYFLVNMLIVVGIIAIPFAGYNIFIGILVGLGLYAISVIASLSPIGETMWGVNLSVPLCIVALVSRYLTN